MLRIRYQVTIALVFLFTVTLFSQTVTYQIGTGSVSGGAMVNTGTFKSVFPDDEEFIEHGVMNTEYNPEPMILDPQGAPVYESMYFEDSNGLESINAAGDNAMLLLKYNISLPNNVAPPDPTIAVGPNHVIVLTNNGTGIFIYDKQGNLLKSLSSTQWWSAVWPSQNGDPQIIYDHYENRWVMLFMQIDDAAQTAGNLIAYSENENPIGTWYMYRLDTRTHGTTSSNTWGDYPQMGFDDKAIYVMTRCFGFTGGLFYNKIRIIPKAQFYASNAGPVTYTDIWDITQPGTSTRPDVIHPSFHYSVSNDHYFLFANRSGGNVYSFYKLSDPIGNPVLTGTNIFVTFFGETPTAVQPGTTTRIESNGSHIKTAPVFRDGYLYATHSIRNSTNAAYGSVKYVKIDVNTNAVVENYELGRDNHYYIFPAIAVDKEHNVLITASRSGPTEYAGAYFLGRRANDPPGLSNAYTLQPGLATYVCTFCGVRNRWGDYLGAYIDPANDLDFWVVSQYAAITNTYALSVGNIRLKPFDGVYLFYESLDFDFGSTELGDTSSVVSAMIANYGTDPLIINSIAESAGDFYRISSFTFPITINTYDSLYIDMIFVPSTTGEQNEVLSISSNVPELTGLNLAATGYTAFPANARVLYGATGTQNSGNLITINTGTALGTNVGPSGYNDLFDLEIDNTTNAIYGLRNLPVASEIYKINAVGGDAFLHRTIDISELYSLAYDSSGILYATSRIGNLYTIDTQDNWSYTQIATLPFERVSIAINPLTNELWGSVRNPIGTPRDRIVKFDKTTGDTLFVGRTGYNVNTTDIVFDETGVLYGVKGSGNNVSDLFVIDQTTGEGLLIDATTIKDIRALAYSIAEPTSLQDDFTIMPTEYSLEQNFPNPFNPNTTIKFSVPTSANIKLTVYNILGETVRVLFDKEFHSGNYSVVWNADDQTGRKVSSGVYFYELKAVSDKGSDFNQIRKMVLLK